MAWRTLSVVAQREEFVTLALKAGANRSELCRRYGISRSKGYKWLDRFKAEGLAGLADRSRRPHNSPGRTPATVESEVLRVREETNNVWSGRKIARTLKNEGVKGVPAPSTIVGILRRNGKLEPQEDVQRGPYKRFEYDAPNKLWQMDFKGHFATARARCHALTVIDDHSRFALALKACTNERAETVRTHLTDVFRRYGLPHKMLMDNGSPWGTVESEHRFTVFTVWLMLLGIRVIHGRPYHPQTQGKDERFHRTIDAEVLSNRSFADIEEVQAAFDTFRYRYNHRRPHEALELEVPASRYQPSSRPFPEQLPAPAYDTADIVRKVDRDGDISWRNRTWRLSKALRGQAVALRYTQTDGLMDVYFCTHRVGQLDLHSEACGFVDIARAMPPSPQAHNNIKTPQKIQA